MTKIFLIGFMASGKTTIGKQLATKLGVLFIDTDDLIVEKVGMSIRTYIEQNGEIAFRKIETETLIGLKSLKNAVISTGGGMPCFNNNMDLINKMGLSYYLCTSLDVIYPRVVNDKNRLLAYQKPKSAMMSLYRSRLKYYSEAKFKVLSNRPTELVTKRIIELMKKNHKTQTLS